MPNCRTSTHFVKSWDKHDNRTPEEDYWMEVCWTHRCYAKGDTQDEVEQAVREFPFPESLEPGHAPQESR